MLTYNERKREAMRQMLCTYGPTTRAANMANAWIIGRSLLAILADFDMASLHFDPDGLRK